MQKLAFDLSRAAIGIRTEPLCLSVGLDQRGSAVRASLGEDRDLRLCRPEGIVNIDDLWNDFSSFDHLDCVTHADVHLIDEILIVESRPPDHRS